MERSDLKVTLLVMIGLLWSCATKIDSANNNTMKATEPESSHITNSERYCLTISKLDYCIDEKFPGTSEQLEEYGKLADMPVYATTRNYRCAASISVVVKNSIIVSIGISYIMDGNFDYCEFPKFPTSGQYIVVEGRRNRISDRSFLPYLNNGSLKDRVTPNK